MQTEATKKFFTVGEYYKMAEAGIFAEEDRTELICGEIIQMSSMGVRHAAAIRRATAVLNAALQGRAITSAELPLRLNEFSEPQPDICLVTPRNDFYTSLVYDRDVKLLVYAAAEISEVWIEDVVGDALLVYRDPGSKGYETAQTFRRSDSVSLLAFPDVRVSVAELLG